MTNIVERAIIPYNTVGAKVVFNNQYHLYAPVAGINKVGMAGFCDDFSISTGQIVSISDKFKLSVVQYVNIHDIPNNVTYATNGVKSCNVIYSGYTHAVQNFVAGNDTPINVTGSLLVTLGNHALPMTTTYSMNETLFADGRIWTRELNVVNGIVSDPNVEFVISYTKDEADAQFRTIADSYTKTETNALLALKAALAGVETFTGKKTFAAGAAVNPAPSAGTDVVNKTYADLKVAKAGNETITGKKTFSAGLDTAVAPAAGADIVNKTYADSKVPKTAIQTSVSGTPLDSNVLSEKFVNTTYRTKADSWSKANLDAHIGALETRVGSEVLSTSLPGNELGQGTLSGIINTLGSHIDSLQLGFVPRTMRNVITPLRSKDPTNLAQVDSYAELVELSEEGFVPDIPAGTSMTLTNRLNAFILADQGRTPNHTDAVVCVDIQAPDRGRLITYYYWDLGTGDEYTVPAGWYVADVNMSPDNITNIGAFTKLLSKTPVGYEEDSTGTRVFAVNGSWKKYSAADLHAIYPTLEYLGLLNLWFIILAPDVDTMNTINNYEPGKSVALVDCAHGMGIDSAISIELLKKVKDVESGSLIQNIQYCKLDQFHVLSNGLVVLYADDPFDGEVVVKTGRAYYVSGATEMMAVPQSQVTGLELALDSKVDKSVIKADLSNPTSHTNLLSEKYVDATYVTKSAIKADLSNPTSHTNLLSEKYVDATYVTKSAIKADLSNPTLDTNLLSEKYVDATYVTKSAIETLQGTSAVKVPSSKLLKESSFARVIRAVTELGLTYPCTTTDILNALYTGAYVNTIVIIGLSTGASANITDLPDNYGTLLIHLGSERLRWVAEWHGNKAGTGADRFYVGKISRSANTVIGVAWSEVIDSSSAQTISAIKTYATGATPLITDQPTTNLMAANKAYVDTTTINPNILTNADFLVNDLGTAVYNVHDTPTVNNWGIKLTNTAGSYTVATKKLKSDDVDIATDYVHLYQDIPNPMFYNGKTVTFSAKAKSTTGKWTLILWKGISTIASVPWDTTLFRTLTYAIPAGTFTSSDTFSVAIRSYSEVELDYAKLEVGSIATAFSPAQNTMLITASPTSNSMAANKAYVDSRNMINYTSFTDVNASYTNETSIATLVGSMGDNTRFSGVFTSANPTSVYPRDAAVYRLYIEKFSSDYAVVNLVDLFYCQEYYKTKRVSTWSSWQSATTEENEWWSSADSTPFTGTGIIDFYVYLVGLGYHTLRMIRPATNVKCTSTPAMMSYSSKLGLYWIYFTGESNVPQTQFWPFDGTGTLYPSGILRARVRRSNNTYDVPLANQ
jgi:hypothetical protein